MIHVHVAFERGGRGERCYYSGFWREGGGRKMLQKHVAIQGGGGRGGGMSHKDPGRVFLKCKH